MAKSSRSVLRSLYSLLVGGEGGRVLDLVGGAGGSGLKALALIAGVGIDGVEQELLVLGEVLVE